MVANKLIKYFPNITEKQINELISFEKEILEINKVINLISRKDVEHVFENHILHSLSIAFLYNNEISKVNSIIDIGTGGGFPGIPLAIMFPNVKFTLVDSIGKKINAVNTIIEKLNLKNVVAYNNRVENLDIKFDIAVARAVAPISKLSFWMQSNWAQKLHFILLKGGNLKDEVDEFILEYKNPIIIKETPIFNHFIIDFFETKKVIEIKEMD